MIKQFQFTAEDNGRDIVSLFDTVWGSFIDLYDRNNGNYFEFCGTYYWDFCVDEKDLDWEKAVLLKEMIDKSEKEDWNVYSVEENEVCDFD